MFRMATPGTDDDIPGKLLRITFTYEMSMKKYKVIPDSAGSLSESSKSTSVERDLRQGPAYLL